MWQAVELRELRLVTALAEELHFGRTAERLQLTPSRVSQSLRDLEHKLGTQLVHRTSRRVQLTRAGERLLADLSPALDQLDGVLERASAAARSIAGTLRLGLLSGPAGGPKFVEVVGAFEARHPECKVDIVQVSWDDPIGRLRNGDLDLMASWVPLPGEFVVGPTLARQSRTLAVARDHPLAESATVDVEQLADYLVVRFDGWPEELHDELFPARTPKGRPIQGLRIPVGERAVLDVAVRVARGECLFPTVESAAAYMGEQLDLVFVPLTGTRQLRSALTWRRPAREPRLRAFIDVARDVLRN